MGLMVYSLLWATAGIVSSTVVEAQDITLQEARPLNPKP